MTELEISIGGRIFSVACDNEEQEKVKEAALVINEEATTIQSQLGRLPESKMLLLSALMVADRLVDMEAEIKALRENSENLSLYINKNKELEKKITTLGSENEKLLKFAEKILNKLEIISNLSDSESRIMTSDDKKFASVSESDQPKLF